MQRTRKTVTSSLSRLKLFLSLFARNPRGVVGLAIIVLFGFLAFGAPLLTPYDPVWSTYVSGQYAAPGWMKYLPSAIGGMPGAAENMAVTNNSNFANGLEGWDYTSAPHVDITYSPDVGISDAEKGSAKITYQRNEINQTYGSTSVCFYKDFYYPFSGTPRKFSASMFLLADATTTNMTERKYVIGTGWVYYNVTAQDVNMTVYMYFQRLSDGQVFPIWPYQPDVISGLDMVPTPKAGDRTPGIGTIYKTTGAWLSTSRYPPDSDMLRYKDVTNVCTKIFNTTYIPANYRFGINITFVDTTFPEKPVQTTLYVDQFYVTFQGRIWGLLGTDHYGRDIWSQLLYGARISLYIGLLASMLAVVIGLIVGLAAGYMGRYVDEILMRFSDMLLVLPGLPLLIVLIAVLGPSIENLVILIGLLGWMGFARLVRSQVLSLKERPFVEAAKAVGAGRTHIISKHILPNVMSLVYVSLATAVPSAIVSEAAISFLGFVDPNRVSWGKMLYEVQAYGAVQYWWWVVPPGLAIAAISIAFILLGFALDEVFNPRLRMRK